MSGPLIDLDRALIDVQTIADLEAAVADLEERFGDLPGAGVPQTYWRPVTLRAMKVPTTWISDERSQAFGPQRLIQGPSPRSMPWTWTPGPQVPAGYGCGLRSMSRSGS